MVGENIKKRREAMGLNQCEFAELINTDQSMVSYIESERKQPSIALLKAIAEAFNCSTDELIFGEQSKRA